MFRSVGSEGGHSYPRVLTVTFFVLVYTKLPLQRYKKILIALCLKLLFFLFMNYLWQLCADGCPLMRFRESFEQKKVFLMSQKDLFGENIRGYCYCLAARRISIILMALSLITVPGPKMAAALALKRKS